MVFAIPDDFSGPSEDRALRDVKSNMLHVLTNPEYAWSTAVQELGLETEDMSDWYIIDRNGDKILIDEVLLVSEIFRSEIPSRIYSYCLYAEIDDYNWEREVFQQIR
jgi:hypothetical protein